MAVVQHRAPRERSAITSLFTDERKAPGFVVYVDCILTRRKRHHMICDRVDAVLFRSRWFSDVMEWLAAEGVTDYELVTDRRRYAVTISGEAPAKGT